MHTPCPVGIKMKQRFVSCCHFAIGRNTHAYVMLDLFRTELFISKHPASTQQAPGKLPASSQQQQAPNKHPASTQLAPSKHPASGQQAPSKRLASTQPASSKHPAGTQLAPSKHTPSTQQAPSRHPASTQQEVSLEFPVSFFVVRQIKHSQAFDECGPRMSQKKRRLHTRMSLVGAPGWPFCSLGHLAPIWRLGVPRQLRDPFFTLFLITVGTLVGHQREPKLIFPMTFRVPFSIFL
jgi:hypothetical protein